MQRAYPYPSYIHQESYLASCKYHSCLLQTLIQEEAFCHPKRHIQVQVNSFLLRNIHLNKNVTILPNGYEGFKTRSCHSFEEIIKYKHEYDYLFLSPIFNSISKVANKSGFNEEELLKASTDGLIDEKVIALGGVTFDKIPYLKRLHFGGVAMIGALYSRETLNHLKEIHLYK